MIARLVDRFGRRRALQWAGLRIIRGETGNERAYRLAKATAGIVREAIGEAVSYEALREDCPP